MILVFIGPQGSGKGTQAELVSEKFSIPHISTGKLLRSAQGELKEKIDKKLNSGELIEDKLMFDILKQRISKEDCKKGFILDGYPRDLEQAKTLDTEIGFDKIIEIDISDKEAIRRLTGRRNCPNCGRNYNLNIENLKPKNDQECDICHIKLDKRKDDNEDAIKKRLDIYHEKTEPILKHFQDRLLKINGEQSIEEVKNEIFEKLTN